MIRCKTCKYYSSKTRTCDFLLRTYKRRGCPVDDCSRYEPNRFADKLVDYYANEAASLNGEAAFVSLYEAGLNDYEIASFTGVSRATIGAWRLRMGLPSQRELSKEAEDSARDH